MKNLIILCCSVLVTNLVYADAEDMSPPSAEQVKRGTALYAQHCAACHGPRMQDPEGAFDLRTFPPDQKTRFITSVTHGKNSMPPWGGLLSTGDIESLWGYVITNQKK
ncbi:MAG: cytochrome c55X [Betaproteobacteria bacterium]|nr:cytochrome c55X [Betaproteobacteria bacterium]